MVDEVITKQELIDAKRDAQDLGKAVNEKVIVSPRYGEDFKSLPMIADEFQDAINTIVIDGGVPALVVSDANGVTQQDINDFGGAKWRNKAGGYALGATVKLDNGDIVKSTINENTNNPNVDMTGWKYPTVKINDSHKDLDYIVNDAIYPYLSRSDRDGMIITADMFDQMLAVARTVDKPLKFRKTDTFELDRSIVIPNFGVELPNIAQFEVDFGGAQVIPLVDDLICFKILAENVTFRQPHFNNRDNKSNCWAYRLGAENDQVAGDPSNQRISTNRFKIYDPICYRFYGFQWVKPAASIGGTMVNGVMQGGTQSGSYYGDVFNPRIQQTYIHFWFDYCVTHDNLSTVWNIYNPQTLGGNCAYLLDNIAGLNVFGGSFEFINSSGLLPDATVIRVRGRQNENSPYATNNCNFFGLTGESLTRFYHVDNKGYLGDALSLVNCQPIAPALPSIGVAGQTSMTVEGDINAVTANGSKPALLAWDKLSNRSIAMIADNVPRLACVPNLLGVPDILKTETGSLKLGTQADGNTNEYVAIDYLERDMILRNARGGGFAFERNSGDFNSPVVYPRQDAGLDLGAASNRWSTIFAVNGVIQTSDERAKTDISNLDNAEKQVAVELRSLIKKYRFKDAVKANGDAARYHFGVIAQEVEVVFKKHNLDAFKYGVLCFDEWDAEYNEDGELNREAGNRYGVRYDELMMFILASM